MEGRHVAMVVNLMEQLRVGRPIWRDRAMSGVFPGMPMRGA